MYGIYTNLGGILMVNVTIYIYISYMDIYIYIYIYSLHGSCINIGYYIVIMVHKG